MGIIICGIKHNDESVKIVVGSYDGLIGHGYNKDTTCVLQGQILVVKSEVSDIIWYVAYLPGYKRFEVILVK